MIPNYPIAARTKINLVEIGRVEQIGKRNMDMIAKVITPAAFDQEELQVWVNIEYTGYREGYRRAWIDAWEECLHVKLTRQDKQDILPSVQDVDHLFPKEKAREYHFPWVRIFAIHYAPNRSWKDEIGADMSFDIKGNIAYLNQTIWNKWLMKMQFSI